MQTIKCKKNEVILRKAKEKSKLKEAKKKLKIKDKKQPKDTLKRINQQCASRKTKKEKRTHDEQQEQEQYLQLMKELLQMQQMFCLENPDNVYIANAGNHATYQLYVF